MATLAVGTALPMILKGGIFAASLIGSFSQQSGKRGVEKLEDVKVGSSAYGQGIPNIYGTAKCTGNMFWATDFDEEKLPSKKKNSKKKQSKRQPDMYEYFGNFAMGLCAGTVGSVVRVWADSNLIYSTVSGDDEDIVDVGFSQEEEEDQKGSKGGGKKSGSSSRFAFIFYNGSEEQVADPTMIAKQGVEKTSAHKGLCYLMFSHFPLADFGNRTPTITAEIVVLPTVSDKMQMFVPFEAQSLTHPVNAGYPDTYVSDNWAVDFIRNRLYTQDLTTGVIRGYSLYTYKEEVRFVQDDVTGSSDTTDEFGDVTITGTNLSKLIGVSDTGQLLFNTDIGTNSRPIAYVTPARETATITGHFGKGATSLGVYEDKFGGPNHAVMLPSSDDDGNTYVTAVLQDFGNILFLKDGKYAGGFDTDLGGGQIFFGVPVNESVLAYKMRGTTSGYEVYRLAIGMPNAARLITEPYVSGKETLIYSRITTPKETVFFDSTFGFVVQGANCIGIFEKMLSPDDPSTAGTYVVKLDPLTGELLWRHKLVHSPSGLSTLTRQAGGDFMTGTSFKYISSGNLIDINFATETVTFKPVAAGVPTMDEDKQVFWANRGGILGYMTDSPTYRDLGMFLGGVSKQAATTLVQIVTDICLKAGLTTAQIDTTNLVDEVITGYIKERPVSGRQIIQELADVYFFDVVESDYKLKFVTRGKNGSVITIEQERLGIIESVGGGVEYMREVSAQQIDLPRTVVVSYIDAANEYETNSAHVRRPISPVETVQTRDVIDISLPMLLKKDAAKAIAHRVLYGMWGERVNYEFSLSWEFLKYDPTDVVTILLDSGLTYDARLTQTDLGANYQIDVNSIGITSALYKSTPVGAYAGGIVRNPLKTKSGVRSLVFDIPYVVDADVDESKKPEVYAAVGSFGPNFQYSVLTREVAPGPSSQNGIENVDGFPSDAVWGVISGDIPPPPRGTAFFDITTEIVLSPAYDFTTEQAVDWISIADDQWPNESNMIVIGREVIKFKDVVENSNGTVTISTLIRGDAGTEDQVDQHTPADTWMLLSGQGVADDVLEATNVNDTIRYDVNPPSALQIGLSQTIVLEGRSLKPWSAVLLTRTVSGPGITMNWEYRTRFAGQLKDGTGTIPTNEDDLSFQVFLLSAAYDPDVFDPGDASTYTRLYEVTTNSSLYSTADMATDSFNPLVDTLHYVVYQMSGQMGRGMPAWASIAA